MADSERRWTFLTNHARVLLQIAENPDVLLREVAASADITERAAQAIVTDLQDAGYIRRVRVGRRNRYTVDPTGRFRHPHEADHTIGGLLDLFVHRETADGTALSFVGPAPDTPPAPDRA